ncbi:MAG: hypothetical protein EBT09_10800 [Actinobacteria bacterium]|nr:hypothetical protein [Actinomycetota bacterium]
MESYPTGARAFTPSPTLPSPALAARPTEAPWLATPLDLRQDPRVLAFTAEVMISGLAPSHRLALALAVDVTFALWTWATRHEPDGTLAGIAPVVIAGVVGWEGDPGALWASLTRSGIVDAFGAITGWASTGGRRGARLSAMALPSRTQVNTTTAVFGPSQRGRRLGLGPEDRKARRQWQNATASANARRRQQTASEPSANRKRTVSELCRSSLTPDLLPPSLLEVEKERISLTGALTREEPETRPARRMHPAWAHPAVVTWLEVCGIPQPRQVQAEAIASFVGDDAGSLTRWRGVCEYGIRNGHNVGAIDWMNDRFTRGGTDRKRSGTRSGISPVTDTEVPKSAISSGGTTEPPTTSVNAGDSALLTLPAPQEWRARTGKADREWRDAVTSYRRIHGLRAFESVPIALVEAWVADQRAKAAEPPSRPVASIPATNCEHRGRPVLSLGEALGTLGG